MYSVLKINVTQQCVGRFQYLKKHMKAKTLQNNPKKSKLVYLTFLCCQKLKFIRVKFFQTHPVCFTVPAYGNKIAHHSSLNGYRLITVYLFLQVK